MTNVAQPQGQPQRRAPAFLTCSVLAQILTLIILAITALVALAWRDGRLEPLLAVWARAQQPASLSPAEAVAQAQKQWSRRSIEVDAGYMSRKVSPEQLGISFDAAATLQQTEARWAATPAAGQKAPPVTPVWRFDRRPAEAYLRALSAEVAVPAQDASLRLSGLTAEPVAAVKGRALDVEATLTRLESDVAGVMERGRLGLVIAPVEPAITDVRPALAKLAQWLTVTVSIQLYDPVADENLAWSIAPQTVAGWLTIAPSEVISGALDCTLDAARVEATLTTLAQSLGAERYIKADEAAPAVIEAIVAGPRVVRQRIYHRPRQHTVRAGETLSSIAGDYGIPYPWIQRANPQLGDALQAGQVITIPSPDALLPLPPVENKRIVVSLSQQKMWAYEAGALKWEWVVSTGIASSPTAPGIFQVQSHEPLAYAASWDLWMPHFMGIYRPAPDVAVMNGFHGFPSRGNQQLLWTGDLGHPVTYGCILLDTENAKKLYAWADDGVVVEIRR